MYYLFISLVAYIINVPLGYVRENCPKFSLAWFFWIHASIPLLIFLRIKWDISPWFIPVSIFFAVLGQISGGRSRKRKMTQEEKDALNQIPSPLIPSCHDIKDAEVAIVLLNMGGPRTNEDVLDFQKRLFEDPLLIRFPLSFLFQKFFAWVLIKFRLEAVKERYQLIGGGSPLFQSTEAQVRALSQELNKRGRKMDVTFSFNYTSPLPAETINEVIAKNKKYILPLSLYPHYSKATTGSNLFYLKEEIKKCAAAVELLPAPQYYLHDGYIQAFVDRIKEEVKPHESLDDFFLLFSAHGLPLYFLTEGDPYPFQISQTIAKILSVLRREQNWAISYQSAVGPLQWLKPSTDAMLEALSREGVKKLIVIPVSFVSDHIETLCEIDIEYRKFAEDLGIQDFRMSKAIECHPQFIKALADTVEGITPGSKVQTKILTNKLTI